MLAALVSAIVSIKTTTNLDLMLLNILFQNFPIPVYLNQQRNAVRRYASPCH
jgi:hypothetical protein